MTNFICVIDVIFSFSLNKKITDDTLDKFGRKHANKVRNNLAYDIALEIFVNGTSVLVKKIYCLRIFQSFIYK